MSSNSKYEVGTDSKYGGINETGFRHSEPYLVKFLLWNSFGK